MTTDEVISAKIRKYRDEKGISELDMANGIGLPFTFYRVFESTPSKFNADLLSKAAGIFGCSVEDLTGAEE
ncbi:MAG: helix-turn-helix domain-containing protein [Coriobacteriia bacterium]